MKKSVLLFLMIFLSSFLFASVDSMYVEETGWREVTVHFSSNNTSCTVHWKRNGEDRWQSSTCNFGSGSLRITNMDPGTYEFRVTPGSTSYSNMSFGRWCTYSIGGRNDPPPPQHRAPPPRRSPPPRRR